LKRTSCSSSGAQGPPYQKEPLLLLLLSRQCSHHTSTLQILSLVLWVLLMVLRQRLTVSQLLQVLLLLVVQ
jgi:hypothetical protein